MVNTYGIWEFAAHTQFVVTPSEFHEASLQEPSSMSPGVFTRPGDSILTMSEYEESRRKRRTGLILILLLLAVLTVFVTLALTVFKARAPRVHINAIDLEAFSVGADSFYMSLLLDLTVHNPNRASFQYSEGVTRVAYHGDSVGQAAIPPGYVASEGNDYLSVLLWLEAARVLVNENLAGDVVRGRLTVLATTTLAGTVTVLGVFKHHAVATSDCEVTVFVANATLKSFECRQAVKL